MEGFEQPPNDTTVEESQPPATPSLEARIQQVIDSKVGPEKLLGVTISIRVDGQERYTFAAGMSDANTPMDSAMKFGIASITKTVVAATIMKLVEEGQLSLQDPISDYLSLNNPNIDESITIYQLLNHLAGIHLATSRQRHQQSFF